MKMKIEPNRFKRMLENVLLYHGGTELDANVGVFTDKGVSFKDISLEVVTVIAMYGKKYFMEYEIAEDGVAFSKSLLAQMRDSFKTDESITVFTEGEKIHLAGKKERYEESLTIIEQVELPWEVVNDATLGVVPKKLNPEIQVLIDPGVLRNLPKTGDYLFRSDGEKLELIIEDEVGKYTKEITLSKKEKLEEFEVRFESSYFNKVLSQFTGEVWLSMNEVAAVFSQKTKDFMLTYIVGSI